METRAPAWRVRSLDRGKEEREKSEGGGARAALVGLADAGFEEKLEQALLPAESKGSSGAGGGRSLTAALALTETLLKFSSSPSFSAPDSDKSLLTAASCAVSKASFRASSPSTGQERRPAAARGLAAATSSRETGKPWAASGPGLETRARTCCLLCCFG